MHALFIIILTPLTIVLGLILLNLVFTKVFWKALGITALALFGIVLIIAVPSQKPSYQPPRETFVPYRAVVSDEERAGRKLAETSALDYPYLRAWAKFSGMTSVRLEGELRRARYNQAPTTAVYGAAGGDWAVLDDIQNNDTRALIVKIAKSLRQPAT